MAAVPSACLGTSEQLSEPETTHAMEFLKGDSGDIGGACQPRKYGKQEGVVPIPHQEALTSRKVTLSLGNSRIIQ